MSDGLRQTPQPLLLYKACNDAISKGDETLIKLYRSAAHPHNGGMCEVHSDTLLEACKVIEHSMSLLGLLLAREQAMVQQDERRTG